MKMTELAPGILASPCVPPACCRKAVQTGGPVITR